MLRSTASAVARCECAPSSVGRSGTKSIIRQCAGAFERRNSRRKFSSLVNSQTQSLTDASRVLRIAKRVLEEKQYAVWDTVLRRISKYESSPRQKRVGVLAGKNCDKEREELISALVGDAMVDAEVRDAVQARWASVPSSAERIKIRYGEKLARFGPILEIPSKSLAALDVEVVEIRGMESAAELLTTNVPILLTSSPAPLIVTRHPNALIVQQSPINPTASIGSVTSRPVSGTLIVNALTERLRTMDTTKVSYRAETLLAALDECSSDLASQDLDAARMNTGALKEQLDELTSQMDTQFRDIDIPQELRDNKQALQASFDQFKWYRLWDIDTLGHQIAYHVATGHGITLERKLEWYAGLMSASQSRIRNLCAEFVQLLPRSLDAATIQNGIEQLQSATPIVASSTFTGVVAHRRRQLAETVTNRLQTRFIRRVYTAMMGVPIAAGIPAMLWANELLSSAYALPSGILAILLCIRHVSTGWGKVRKHWWADYDRINLGMEDDIVTLVKRTKEAQVMDVPRELLSKIEGAVARREALIRQMQSEVKDAQNSLEKKEGFN